MINRKDSMFDRLILMGAIEPSGMDMETGEMLFTFTPDIQEKFPELAKSVYERMSGTIMNLWSKGFLNIKYEDNDNDPLVSLTEKCSDDFAISVLPEFENAVLKNIIEYFRQNEV